MTKDELKYIKDQQSERERAYREQIRALRGQVQILNENKELYSNRIDTLLKEKDQLLRENRILSEHIEHLQQGLTGEERDYYSESI